MITPERMGELHSLAVVRAAEAIHHSRVSQAVDDVCTTNEEADFFRKELDKISQQVRNLP